MKTTLALLMAFGLLICHPHAESFSSSTNFIRTLTIATNEAIFITTLKQSGAISANGSASYSPLLANVTRNNETTILPIQTILPILQLQSVKQIPPAFAGPMSIQFQNDNVFIEFQRIQTTNVYTTFFNPSNGITVYVPSGKTISFLRPTSWFNLEGNIHPYATCLIVLSNDLTVLKETLFGGESFSGPLTLTLIAGSTLVGNPFDQGVVTHYFTEEFASFPDIGATLVPAGKTVLTIEKTQDLIHWETVLFKPVESDTSKFYRFKFAK